MHNVHAVLRRIRRLPQQLLIVLVQGYRLLLKPRLGNACRFEPTCSAYALRALQRHGAVVGAALAAGRVLRCQPWCQGGCDEVPLHAPRLFSHLGLGHSAIPPSNQSPP
ncbi:MAG: membrane protein insertion efficiency factor YidD [Rubrivivax sp.]